jgi:large subunit ribosomal protein L18
MDLRKKRHKKIRTTIKGTDKRPRLCVFRSNKYIYAQLIDDDKNRVLLQASDIKMKKAKKVEKASKVGEKIAKMAQDKKIKKIVFDRAGYKYHGRVKALAEAVRKQGLNF